MHILSDADAKIQRFNADPRDRPRAPRYHSLLTAKLASGPPVLIHDKYHRMIDQALRSYFSMNRGGRMGSETDFVGRLKDKLRDRRAERILARFSDVKIASSDLAACKSDAKELYEFFSNPEDGLSRDRTWFCVGATRCTASSLNSSSCWTRQWRRPSGFIAINTTTSQPTGGL